MTLHIIGYTPRKLQAVAYRICAKILELDWYIKAKYEATCEDAETYERTYASQELDFILPSVTLENFNERVECLKSFLMGFSMEANDSYTQDDCFRTLTLTMYTNADVLAEVYELELAPVTE